MRQIKDVLSEFIQHSSCSLHVFSKVMLEMCQREKSRKGHGNKMKKKICTKTLTLIHHMVCGIGGRKTSFVGLINVTPRKMYAREIYY
mgnify:FL=1